MSALFFSFSFLEHRDGQFDFASSQGAASSARTAENIGRIVSSRDELSEVSSSAFDERSVGFFSAEVRRTSAAEKIQRSQSTFVRRASRESSVVQEDRRDLEKLSGADRRDRLRKSPVKTFVFSLWRIAICRQTLLTRSLAFTSSEKRKERICSSLVPDYEFLHSSSNSKMVKTYAGHWLYTFPWSQVVSGFWQKYPNPYT